ncbi:MAG TPA: hypothetical protein DEP46_03770 [Blastocatellia bacterium]|jgi:hypothetical protein|nr:hypothetical protein [Blastocatellia bacterium]
MRNIITALGIALLLSGVNYSQNIDQSPGSPKTKIEAFQARTGVVIIQGFSEVGSVRGLYVTSVTVKAKEFLDAASGRKEFGITVEVKDNSGRIERENTSWVDYDEIESLLKGLDYIAKVDRSVTQLANFQADFRTKGDLGLSVFSSRDENLLAVKSGRIGAATAYFKFEDISNVRGLLASAKEQIDKIRGTAGK